SGPWQMGKVDQGFVVLWAARHLFGGTLKYIGFGGEGLQVRDVLHVAGLYDLIRMQIEGLDRYSGLLFNVGGGRGRRVALAERTRLCRQRAGRTVEPASEAATHAADVPYYVTDNFSVTAATGWTPRRGLDALLDDIFLWLNDHRAALEPILGEASRSLFVGGS